MNKDDNNAAATVAKYAFLHRKTKGALRRSLLEPSLTSLDFNSFMLRVGRFFLASTFASNTLERLDLFDNTDRQTNKMRMKALINLFVVLEKMQEVGLPDYLHFATRHLHVCCDIAKSLLPPALPYP